jgi:hypothetical protein
MKKGIFLIMAMVILAVSLISVILNGDNKGTTNAEYPKVEVITEREKMLEAVSLVNKAMPKINHINKGKITSNFSGFFMLAGTEVKEETIIEKTEGGINYKTTVTHSDGTTEFYEAVSDKPISEIVHMQWYPNEEIKKGYFDNAEKLTIYRDKGSIEYRIDWNQDEIKATSNIYLQYLYSQIIIDKNGYISEWSFYAKSYQKDSEGNKINIEDSIATVQLTDYAD